MLLAMVLLRATDASWVGLAAEMSISFIAFALAFIIVGLALDAAFFWRFKNMLEVFRNVPASLNYRHYAFFRLFLIAGSAFVVALGSYGRPTNATIIIVGCVAFMAFSSYPHIDMYLRSKRVD
jgi:hypothetical protein